MAKPAKHCRTFWNLNPQHLHTYNIFRDKELDRNSVVKDYLTTAADGKPYQVMFYSLPMILAIGYKEF